MYQPGWPVAGSALTSSERNIRFIVWYKHLQEGTFEKLPCKDNQPSIEVDIT
jgi:hypothetical protein